MLLSNLRDGRRQRRYLKAALVAAMTALLCIVVACAPQPAVETDAAALANTSSEQAGSGIDLTELGYSDFTDRGSGYYPDNFFTEGFINSENRGCNACHDDLWETIKDLSPIQHLASSKPGYGQKADWTDCYYCHEKGIPLGGIQLRDAVHSVHMSNAVFTDDLHGNCFSCHVVDSQGEYKMFDFYKHSDEFGGWPNAGSDAVLDWVEGRTWQTSTISGITVERDMKVDVKLKQEPSAKEEMYQASNYAIPEQDVNTWTLKITGVNNEREFTYDELKALPQTEMTAAMMCGANTIGSYQVGNVPMTGVSLQDLIDACGGLKDGMVSAGLNAADGWRLPSMDFTYDLQTMLDQNAMIVITRWGEPLTVEEGFPVAFAFPGTHAGTWSKWLTGIDFVSTPGISGMDLLFGAPTEIVDKPGFPGESTGGAMVNSGWFTPANDGEIVKFGQPIELKGYAYTWSIDSQRLDQIAFSSDYGNTWTTVDVPDDFDSAQWTEWTATWQPAAPGVYELYVCGISEKAGWQQYPAAITVVVEE